MFHVEHAAHEGALGVPPQTTRARGSRGPSPLAGGNRWGGGTGGADYGRTGPIPSVKRGRTQVTGNHQAGRRFHQATPHICSRGVSTR